MSDSLVLKFDPNTIEHLGISLYSKLPSVLSELVSNSWDADADEITIDFINQGDTKEIVYSDDGEGMAFNELQEKYLVIGRNRRKDTSLQVSKKGRKVIGKKGLGKLSVFGICDIIEVISVKGGVKNHFSMDLSEIRKSKEQSYAPVIISKDQLTTEKNGTTLHLKKIRRRSSFELDKIALSLSKKFLIFDEMIASLTLNGNSETPVTNDLKYKELNTEFEWKFPDEKYDTSYGHWGDVSGTIYTLKTPVKDTYPYGYGSTVYVCLIGKSV